MHFYDESNHFNHINFNYFNGFVDLLNLNKYIFKQNYVVNFLYI